MLCRLMLSRVAETALLDRRATSSAPRTSRACSTSTTTPCSTRRSRTPASRGSGSSRCSATRTLPRALRRRTRPSNVARLGALARRQPERGRELRHDRARERALGARADLRRDVGGDQQAVPARRAANRPRPSRAGRTRSSRSSATARTASRAERDATMTHGEPYEFIQLGLQLERATTTVRIVRVALPGRASRSPRTIRLRAHELIALLKSCSAFEAYVQAARGVVRAARDRGGADPLDRLSPRGPLLPAHVRLHAVDRIASDQGAPQRVLGRLCAEVEYGERGRRLGRRCRTTLRELLAGIHRAGDAVDEGVLLEPRAPGGGARDPGGAATAMWLTVEHVTRFAYDAPINEAYTEIRLKPLHRDGQRCSSFALATEPRGVYRRRVHGPVRQHGAPLRRARGRTRASRSRLGARCGRRQISSTTEPTPSPLDRWDFLAGTRYVGLDDQVAELAASTPPPGDPVEDAWQLMSAVRGAMTYESGTTHVHTTAAEALADGRGVCQDFAHVMIGACRSRGIPARYVSGYLLRPGSDGGEGESHAWVDVYVGDTLDLARPDARPRADRALRPRRRRPRLRGRASLARRLQGHGDRDARGRSHDQRSRESRGAAPVTRRQLDLKLRMRTACRPARQQRARNALGLDFVVIHHKSPRGRGDGRRSARDCTLNGFDQRRQRPLHRAESPGDSQRERSASPISFEIARTSTAGTPASSAARRTPNPSIASTSSPCDTVSQAPPTAADVWIAASTAPGIAPQRGGDERGIGPNAVDHRPLGGQVAVHGLGADDESCPVRRRGRPRRRRAAPRRRT